MRRFLGTIFVLLFLVSLQWGALWLGDAEFRDKADWVILEIRNATTAPDARKFRKARPPHHRVERSWRAIDDHAIATPDSLTHDYATLAKHLVAPAKDDWDRARAIYRWIAENVSYDDVAYNNKEYGSGDAERTLRTHKGVCGDFSELFKELARAAGMEAVKVTGWSKTKDLPPGTRLDQPDHAWNAIKIEGRWQLVDVTWGQGHGDENSGKLVTVKEFSEHWFATPPSEFVMQHLPEDPDWQFLADPVSLDEFEQFPLVRSDLFEMGFSGNTLLRWIRANPGESVPIMYANPFTVKAVNVPLSRRIHLPPGEEMELAFDCPDCKGMAIAINNDLKDMQEGCDRYSLCFVPKPGELKVFARKRRNDLRYIGIMEYEVR
ncbi:MAG: transglutaminase domain-containing protein [Bacteroidia bacterium]